MSRKDMIEQAAQIPHIPAEIGPALKMLGAVLQDAWMNKNGIYLNKDDRKGHSPIAEIADTDLEVRVKGKIIRFTPAKAGKPVVSIPVGMSDKVSTATIPRDWESGQAFAAIVEVFEGDPYVLNMLTDRMCEAIDNASEIDPETGRLKINQDKLPPVRHAVVVAEAMAKLKRSFKTQSAGSPAINLSFEIEDIEEPQPVVVEAEPLASIADRVSSIMQPITIRSGPAPTVEPEVVQHATNEQIAVSDEVAVEVDSTCEECGGEIESIYSLQGREDIPENGWCAQELPGCRPISHEMREALAEPEVVQHARPPAYIYPDNIDMIKVQVLSVLTKAQAWLTMGQIKKALWEGSFGRIKPKQWSSIMAQMVEEGSIMREGERRGTRYSNHLMKTPIPVEALADDGPMGNYYADDDLDHLEEFSNDPEVVESVKAEFADIIADADPVILDEEVIMVDFIDDGPRREAPHLDVCCACDSAS